MVFPGSALGSALRAEICRQTSRFQVPGSCRQFNRLYQICQNSPYSSASDKKLKVESIPKTSILGNLHGLKTVNSSLPYAMSFRNYIHSGKQAEIEVGKTSESIDYEALLQENGNGATISNLTKFGPGLFSQNENARSTEFGPDIFQVGRQFSRPQMFQEGRQFSRSQLESNADIVHIKIMRNNAFVTVTDSKGNVKKGTTAGRLAAKGTKLPRYNAETAAEMMGREVRKMRTTSVVMKVNGHTFFKKKSNAIQSFREGYTNSRGDVNPVIYVEDVTQKPHNGCRRKKQRRI